MENFLSVLGSAFWPRLGALDLDLSRSPDQLAGRLLQEAQTKAQCKDGETWDRKSRTCRDTSTVVIVVAIVLVVGFGAAGFLFYLRRQAGKKRREEAARQNEDQIPMAQVVQQGQIPVAQVVQ